MRARQAEKLKKGDVIFNRHTNMFVRVDMVELIYRPKSESVYMIHTIDRLNRKEKWTHIYFNKVDKEDVEWYLNSLIV